MDNIYEYISALFAELGFYSFFRSVFLIIALVGLMYSVYSPIENLDFLTLLSLCFQVAAWLLKVKIKRINNIVNELQKVSMLNKSYNEVPNSFDLSHVIAKISPFSKICLSFKRKKAEFYKKTIGRLLARWFRKKSYEEYLLEDDSSPGKILLSMIHENSYWNHNLYKSISKIGGVFILIVIIISIFSLLYLIPQVKNGMDYSVIRVVFVFLSFTIIYDFIEKIIQYYESSKIMLEIDNEIQRKPSNEVNIIDIFDKYIKTKEKTSSIPSIIYSLNNTRLNEGWEMRVKLNKSKALQ